MKASEYGIRNLKRIVKNLPEWTKEEGDRYQNLNEMYDQVVTQFNRYANHVTKNIGGLQETFKSVEEQGNVYEPAAKNLQRNAVTWLHQFVFSTPTWLIDQNILNKIEAPTTNLITTLQNNILTNLLSATRMHRMLEISNRFGNGSYTIIELLTDVKTGIWQELRTHKVRDMYRRNLQKAYVERLIALMNPTTSATISSGFSLSFGPSTRNTDLPSVARGHLSELLTEIKTAESKTIDKITRYHLNDITHRIDIALNPK